MTDIQQQVSGKSGSIRCQARSAISARRRTMEVPLARHALAEVL